MAKSASSPRLIPIQVPHWLQQTGQQIQVTDYELHAAIRIISKGEMDPEHIPAFMDACIKRDRLMARVMTYLAELHRRTVYHLMAGEGNGKP